MSNDRNFVNDDENDTLLFERWETHVIENHPNPQRIGCPSHDILRAFVEKPEGVTLADLNDTHITKCRECTLELKELRRRREEKHRDTNSLHRRQFWRRWRLAAVSVFCVALAGFVTWQHHRGILLNPTADSTIAESTVELSADPGKQSSGTQTATSLFSLPRKIVDLNLVLPHVSPAGDYEITIVREEDDEVLETEAARIVARGARTEGRVRLDLRRLPRGRYRLGTTRVGETETHFYLFTLD